MEISKQLGMPLTERQESAINGALNVTDFAVWWRVGEGKTRIALGWFAMLAKRFKSPRAFLVVCRRIAFQDWIDENYELDLPFRVLVSEGGGIHPPVRCHQLVLMSHAKLPDAVSDLVSVPHLAGVAYDEGYLFKNPQSQKSKAALALSECLKYRMILSGSIMTARDPRDIWGQMRAINGHHRLARTSTEFNSKYMIAYDMQLKERTFTALAPRRGAVASIAKTLRHNASTYFPRSSRTIRRIIKHYDASPKMLRYFDSLREEFYIKLQSGDEIEFKFHLQTITKIQQISSGYFRHGESVETFESPKVSGLLALLDELWEAGESCVVWTAFRYDIVHLANAIQHPTIQVMGGKAMDRAAIAKRGAKIVLATEAIGSSFNAFKNIPYAIYFSMSPKWLDLQQSMGRHDRKGGTHDTAYYYFLQTVGSFDEHIYKIATNAKAKEHDLIKSLRQWQTQAK